MSDDVIEFDSNSNNKQIEKKSANITEIIASLNPEKFWTECSQCVQLHSKTQQLVSQNEKDIERLTINFLAFEDALHATFGERERQLDRIYEALHHGIETNNSQEIVEAIRGISSIVVKDPFEHFENAIKALNVSRENPDIPLLDF